MHRMQLPEGEIHVWFAPIEIAGSVAGLLSQPEVERAGRFRVEAPRQRCIAARGLLRQLLGRYLDADPRRLAFVEGEHGKPALADGGIEFNISHADDLVALAFGRTALGVDVEAVRPMRDAVQIARRFFSAEEAERVIEAENVDDVFFTIWTAKEAVVKAIGRGIGAGLQRFTVPHPASALQRVRGFDQWWIASVSPQAEDYRAAVAVGTPELRIVTRELA